MRWILFLWVRVEVFPQPDPANGIDPLQPVLYVLADRGLSDLLVLNELTSNNGMPDPLARAPTDCVTTLSSGLQRRIAQPAHRLD